MTLLMETVGLKGSILFSALQFINLHFGLHPLFQERPGAVGCIEIVIKHFNIKENLLVIAG